MMGHADWQDLGFTQTAEQLAGLIPVSLGWTPDQFWRATPAELVVILVAYSEKVGRAELAPLSGGELNKLKEGHPDDGDDRR
jgi:hypothetical protein